MGGGRNRSDHSAEPDGLGAHDHDHVATSTRSTSSRGSLLVGFSGTGVDHRGGTLYARIADPAFEPFDPAGCCDIPGNVLDLSYDGLLALSKSPSDPGQLVPDLALAIPAAENGGRNYTFRLRPGLRYWNGAQSARLTSSGASSVWRVRPGTSDPSPRCVAQAPALRSGGAI